MKDKLMIPATSILNVEQYWEHFMPYLPEVTGVYLLTIGNFSYVGASINIKNRVRQHLSALRCGNHTRLIQSAFNCQKFIGAIVLEVCDYKDSVIKEAYWINRLSPELNEIHPQESTECEMSQNPNQRLYLYTCFPARNSEISYQEYIWQEKCDRETARYARLKAKYGLDFNRGRPKHPMYEPNKQKDYYLPFGNVYRELGIFVCGVDAQSIKIELTYTMLPRHHWEIIDDGNYELFTKRGAYILKHRHALNVYPPSILYYDGTPQRKENADTLVKSKDLFYSVLKEMAYRGSWNGKLDGLIQEPSNAIAYVDKVFFPSIDSKKLEERKNIEAMLIELRSALEIVTVDDIHDMFSSACPEGLQVRDIIRAAKSE